LKEFIAQKPNRLDKFLQLQLQQPRNQIEHLIKDIGVSVDGKRVNKCGFKLKGGERVSVEIPAPKKESAKEIEFDIDLIYEDDDLLVINKPPHLVIHPAPSVKEPTLVDWLKHKGISLSTLSGEERHGIVHRIDKETSGALVVAKNNASHRNLSMQLENRSMGRYYIALIDLPLKESIIVDKPIFRDRKNRIKMAIDPNGRDAKSAFLKLATARDEKMELIACKLFSGRTHQIRVHLSSLSRHIIGDTLYGFKSKKDRLTRVMLHAKAIYFVHPKSGQKMLFEAPIFEDFKEILEKKFDKERLDEALDSDYIIERFDSFI
jgi:23S rRNA pseudouridine1911/1915/1917 synthase